MPKYIHHIYFVFVNGSWFIAPKIFGMSFDKSNKVVFCYDNKVTFGEHFGNLRMGTGWEENQP